MNLIIKQKTFNEWPCSDGTPTLSAKHIGTTLKHERIQTGTTDKQEVIFLHSGREGPIQRTASGFKEQPQRKANMKVKIPLKAYQQNLSETMHVL